MHLEVLHYFEKRLTTYLPICMVLVVFYVILWYIDWFLKVILSQLTQIEFPNLIFDTEIKLTLDTERSGMERYSFAGFCTSICKDTERSGLKILVTD